MKKIVLLVVMSAYSFYGFCQERFLNAYCKVIPHKYANKMGRLEVSKLGSLVLYLGDTPYELYVEEWNPNTDKTTIIVNGKKKNVMRSELRKMDYLLIHGNNGDYDITIRDGSFTRIYAKGNSRANRLFKSQSEPAHYAHGSHYSSYLK